MMASDREGVDLMAALQASFAPTTEDIRCDVQHGSRDPAAAGQRFDRWLAAYTDKVREETKAGIAGAIEALASTAYPEDVFPPPDLTVVRAALEAAGCTLDAVSAEVTRRMLPAMAHTAREWEPGVGT